MKKLSIILVLILSFVTIVPANAKVRAGLKLGANINSTEFDVSTQQYVFDNTYLANFTGGLALEWMMGLGFGIDFGGIYKACGTEYKVAANVIENDTEVFKEGTLKTVVHYLEAPLFLKYKLQIPAIKKAVAPFIFGGPSFAFKIGETFRFSDQGFVDIISIENSDVDFAICAGAGLEIIEKLHVSLQYSWGMGAVSELSITNIEDALSQAKSGSWSATATWFF